MVNSIEIDDGSILRKYLDAARNLSSEERGKLLENDTSFTEAHQELAVEGQTDANSDEPVLHHFVVFVNHNNELYELDGRKSYPIKHGDTTDDTFLQVLFLHFSLPFFYIIAWSHLILMNTIECFFFLGCGKNLQGCHGTRSRRSPFQCYRFDSHSRLKQSKA